MANTIFIQIAAYRDPQLIPTLQDCLTMARHPENLVFSIAWQHAREDAWDQLDAFKSDPRFRILEFDYRESQGVCWARHQLQQHYAGEAFTLQLDSHHRFVPGWDQILLDMYAQLRAEGYPKPLLTGYVPSFDPQNDPAGRMQVPQKMHFDRFTPEGVAMFVPAAIPEHQSLQAPLRARFYSAGFAFTTGDFVTEVPHDPEFYFHGEEISITVRAFTWGYDLFHPHRIILWHQYTRKGEAKHWDDHPQWVANNCKGLLRNKQLFRMDGEGEGMDFGRFGFGPVRTVDDYCQYAGISFAQRAVQHYTLEHRPPPNPRLSPEAFAQSLVSVFSYGIKLQRTALAEAADYDFCAVIFEDAAGQSLYRKDLTPEAIRALLVTDAPIRDAAWVTIPCEFHTQARPAKWIVWPHSARRGWLQRMEGMLGYCQK